MERVKNRTDMNDMSMRQKRERERERERQRERERERGSWTVKEAGYDKWRRAGAYLTDNVVIVRQVVGVGWGRGRGGVTQFPYIWLRAVRRGGDRHAVRLRLGALGAVLTGGQEEKAGFSVRPE